MSLCTRCDHHVELATVDPLLRWAVEVELQQVITPPTDLDAVALEPTLTCTV
jgi:hypothetical protein